MSTTDGPFRFTTGRWFNRLLPSGKYAKVPAYHQGFRYGDFAYGNDYPEQYLPDAPVQVSIICAPSTHALAIDVDYPQALAPSQAGAVISQDQAISVRGDHFHILVDMRAIAPDDWPQQGRTAWGDIKAAGFIPLPGSAHYSGQLYESTGNPVIPATPELVQALKDDRLAHAQARLAQAAGPGNPRVAGLHLDNGAYVFASGYVKGSWAQLPDGFLRHDDELKDLAWDMGLRGLDASIVESEWHRLAGADDPGEPWTSADFARHWRHVPAAAAAMREAADADERGWDALGVTAEMRAAALTRYQVPETWEPYDDSAPELAPVTQDGDSPGLAEQSRAWLGTWEFMPRGDTDSQDAEDTLARNYPVSRYSPQEDVWLARDLDRWRVVPADQSEGLVENLVPLIDPARRGRSLKQLTAEGADPLALTDEQREQILAYEKRRKFGNAGSAGGIARKIRAKLRSPVPNPYWTDPAELDRDPYELWAGGVAWDLRASMEGLVQRARPSKHVHLHSAGYKPRYSTTMSKDAPLFTELTGAVWPDPAERDWALNVLAVGFTGSPRKVLPVLQGDRDCGKTTAVQMMIDVLGTYGGVVNRKLLDGDANTHDTIIMDLMGLRLAYLDEGIKAGKVARDRLKNIAGGGDLTGHRMRKDSVRFRATHTLVMSANPGEEPPLDDPAIRSRIRWVPCHGDPAAVIAAARKLDYFNSPEWRKEAPYVLGHMIVRCAQVLADESVLDKARAPLGVQDAEQAAAEEQDDILQWFKEATMPAPEGYPARMLYLSFREWFTALHGPRAFVIPETRWGRRMNELIPEDAPSSGTRLTSSANTILRRARPRGYLLDGVPDSPGSFPGQQGNAPASAGPVSPGAAPQSRASAPGSPGKAPGDYPEAKLSDYPGNYPDPPTSKNVVLPDSSDSPDSSSLAYTYTHAHAHAQSLEPGTTPDSPDCPDEEPVPAALPAKAPRTRKTPGPKPEEPGALELKPRKLTRLELDPSLGGPEHPLPVLVIRDPSGPPLVVPCSPADAVTAVERYLGALCVDCETTGFPVGHAAWALRTVQLGGEHAAAVLDPADPAQAAVIRSLLERAAGLHAHSAAADLVPLARAGLADRDALWAKMTDSVLKVKLADPSMAGSDENELKKLARDLLGGYAVSPDAEKAKNELFKAGGWLVKTAPLTPPERSGWAQVRPGCEVMARYAGSDVLDLAAVVRALPEPDPAVLAREREFQAMCARVAHDGFRLDPAHIAAKITEHEAARDALRERVSALCPAITNPSSTKEVPAALAALGVPLGLTAAGKPSAAKAELERLAADASYEHHELLTAILGYRHHVTTLGLLLEPLGLLCEHGDGRMRPVVYTINADTGRTSCVRPNGQQFSRQGGIRACVIADPGMLGISADFSGVEVRVAAALSGDMDLLRAELDGTDHESCADHRHGLHWMAAKMAWGAGATKENRYAAKRIIFSKLFGGSAKAGARQTGVPHEAALAVHQAFEAIAPRYAEWDREMRAYADSGSRAYRAYSGRTIWLPRGRAHAAGNYAIQGTARELLVDGALKWHKTRWGQYPMLPIHDELLTWVPAAEAREALETLKACMRNELNGVPIEAAADEPFLAWPDSS